MISCFGEGRCLSLNYIRLGDKMNIEQIKDYCLKKHNAYEDYPFGDIPICYKLGGKIFAQIYLDGKITLKCTREDGEFYRMIYPEKVVRGYHCPPVQQPYWNTVYYAELPDDEVMTMIDRAYDTVLKGFSKKRQRELSEQR